MKRLPALGAAAVAAIMLIESGYSHAQVIGSDLLVARGNGGPPSPSITRLSGLNGSNQGPFTFGGSLSSYNRLTYGPNGNLFVSSELNGEIQEFNGTTGAFIRSAVATTPTATSGFAFGPDANIYRVERFSVAQAAPQQIVEYNGTTGQPIGVFVSSAMSGFSIGPSTIKFGPDGNLWAGDRNRYLRFDGQTGMPLGVIIAQGSGGLDNGMDFLFRPNGNVLVSDFTNDRVLQYDGITGAFIGVFASGDGLTQPLGMTLGPDGLLYVVSFNQQSIYRFNGATGGFQDIFATLSFPSPRPNYITFTATIVPEPSSLCLASLASAIGGAVVRRRRSGCGK